MKSHWIRAIAPLLVFSATLSAAIERIEPMNWWVGMKEPVFQILIYGDGIGTAIPSIESEQVTLERWQRVESENYLFLYVRVGVSAEGGTFEIELQYGEEAEPERIRYSLEDRDPGADVIEGFNPSDVIYLLMPDRFANGNPENDSVEGMLETAVDRSEPYGRHGGDLAGVINHLDYFEELGVTALWLNPVLENDMPRSSYHGYAITDFYKVDPRFGTLEDYKMLSMQARKKGMKLIMDMVFNHCGSEHWWMKDLPSADWINYSDDFRVTNHKRTTHQDPYASSIDTELMTRGWFVESMPDLNLRNPLLADYMIQNSIWWIETLKLGGIRMDTYPYPDKHAMSDWCQRVMSEYPRFNITGEEWSLNPSTLAYWQEGHQNPDGYEGHLPSLIDFPLQNAIMEAFQEEEAWNGGFIKVYEMLANDSIYANPSNFVTFLGNHDMPRYYMEVDSSEAAYRNALVFLLTTRGIPQLYYGDEILMTHHESDGHGHIRKDFPGGWEGDETNVFTEHNLQDHESRTLELTRKLLNWRKNKQVVHVGKLMHFGPVDGCYVYFRYFDDRDDAIMVVLNKNNSEYPLQLERFAEVLGPFSSAYDVIRGELLELADSLTLMPGEPYILELRK